MAVPETSAAAAQLTAVGVGDNMAIDELHELRTQAARVAPAVLNPEQGCGAAAKGNGNGTQQQQGPPPLPHSMLARKRARREALGLMPAFYEACRSGAGGGLPTHRVKWRTPVAANGLANEHAPEANGNDTAPEAAQLAADADIEAAKRRRMESESPPEAAAGAIPMELECNIAAGQVAVKKKGKGRPKGSTNKGGGKQTAAAQRAAQRAAELAAVEKAQLAAKSPAVNEAAAAVPMAPPARALGAGRATAVRAVLAQRSLPAAQRLQSLLQDQITTLRAGRDDDAGRRSEPPMALVERFEALLRAAGVAAEACEAGLARCVALVGQQGAGKTRLLNRLLAVHLVDPQAYEELALEAPCAEGATLARNETAEDASEVALDGVLGPPTAQSRPVGDALMDAFVPRSECPSAVTHGEELPLSILPEGEGMVGTRVPMRVRYGRRVRVHLRFASSSAAVAAITELRAAAKDIGGKGSGAVLRGDYDRQLAIVGLARDMELPEDLPSVAIPWLYASVLGATVTLCPPLRAYGATGPPPAWQPRSLLAEHLAGVATLLREECGPHGSGGVRSCWGLVEEAVIELPCRLLEGGLEIVDTPGCCGRASVDGVATAAAAAAAAVVLVAPPRRIDGDVWRALARAGVPARVLADHAASDGEQRHEGVGSLVVLTPLDHPEHGLRAPTEMLESGAPDLTALRGKAAEMVRSRREEVASLLSVYAGCEGGATTEAGSNGADVQPRAEAAAGAVSVIGACLEWHYGTEDDLPPAGRLPYKACGALEIASALGRGAPGGGGGDRALRVASRGAELARGAAAAAEKLTQEAVEMATALPTQVHGMNDVAKDAGQALREWAAAQGDDAPEGGLFASWYKTAEDAAMDAARDALAPFAALCSGEAAVRELERAADASGMGRHGFASELLMHACAPKRAQAAAQRRMQKFARLDRDAATATPTNANGDGNGNSALAAPESPGASQATGVADDAIGKASNSNSKPRSTRVMQPITAAEKALAECGVSCFHGGLAIAQVLLAPLVSPEALRAAAVACSERLVSLADSEMAAAHGSVREFFRKRKEAKTAQGGDAEGGGADDAAANRLAGKLVGRLLDESRVHCQSATHAAIAGDGAMAALEKAMLNAVASTCAKRAEALAKAGPRRERGGRRSKQEVEDSKEHQWGAMRNLALEIAPFATAAVAHAMQGIAPRVQSIGKQAGAAMAECVSGVAARLEASHAHQEQRAAAERGHAAHATATGRHVRAAGLALESGCARVDALLCAGNGANGAPGGGKAADGGEDAAARWGHWSAEEMLCIVDELKAEGVLKQALKERRLAAIAAAAHAARGRTGVPREVADVASQLKALRRAYGSKAEGFASAGRVLRAAAAGLRAPAGLPRASAAADASRLAAQGDLLPAGWRRAEAVALCRALRAAALADGAAGAASFSLQLGDETLSACVRAVNAVPSPDGNTKAGKSSAEVVSALSRLADAFGASPSALNAAERALAAAAAAQGDGDGAACGARELCVARGVTWMHREASRPERFQEHAPELMCSLAGVARAAAAAAGGADATQGTPLGALCVRLALQLAERWLCENTRLPEGYSSEDVFYTANGISALRALGQEDDPRVAALTAHVRAAMRRFQPQAFLGYDARQGAQMLPSGRPACREVTEALIAAYFLHSAGMDLGGAFSFAAQLEMVRALPLWSAPGPESGLPEGEYIDQLYLVTHIVFTASQWGSVRLDSTNFANEFGALERGLVEARRRCDVELVGEVAQCLKILGLKEDRHAALREACEWLVARQESSGAWSGADVDYRTRNHSTMCAVGALLA